MLIIAYVSYRRFLFRTVVFSSDKPKPSILRMYFKNSDIFSSYNKQTNRNIHLLTIYLGLLTSELVMSSVREMHKRTSLLNHTNYLKIQI